MKERIEEIINKTKAKKINSKLLYDGGFIKLYEEEYLLPDNRKIKKERVVKSNGLDAVVIVTRTVDDKFLMVFQNRVDEVVSCEFPSGYIEKDEKIEKAALRELAEETGFVSDDVRIVDSFISSIGTENSTIHIVYVNNAKKEKNQELDSDEYINYELFTFDELTYLFDNHIIKSGGNRLAYYHLKELLNK